MASLILIISLIGSLISSAQSLICSSQSFHNNKSFTHCEDLPHLNAFLHWTHHPLNSSLSVAFLAPPPSSGGWVAWAVNPTFIGMAGAQALVASLSGGSPIVRTFDVSSYFSVFPSPELSFPVWDLAAEFSDGRFTIFATVKVPPKAVSLNQVWQVGPAVDPESGSLAVHEFDPANLNSKGVLVFDKKGGGGGSSPALLVDGRASSAPVPAVVGVDETDAAASVPGSDKGGVAGVKSGNLGLAVGLFGFIWGIFN